MSIASELTALATNLQNAKNAVTAKGGTVGDTGLAGLSSEIASIPSGGGGGDVVNAVIKQYKATTTNISANSFVEFVGGLDTSNLNDGSIHVANASAFGACLINSSDVLLAYGVQSTITVVPCTINGNNIVAGTVLTLSVGSNGGTYISLVSLGDKAVLFHRSSNYLRGDIITVENGTAVAGSSNTINTLNAYTYYALGIDSSHILIEYQVSTVGTSVELWTISGGTISRSTAISVSESSVSGTQTGRSLTKIDNTHVFVTYRSEVDSAVLRGAICTIAQDNSISLGTRQDLLTLPSGSITGTTQGVLKSSNRVLLIVTQYISDPYAIRLWCADCSISGDTIATSSYDLGIERVVSSAPLLDGDYLRIFVNHVSQLYYDLYIYTVQLDDMQTLGAEIIPGAGKIWMDYSGSNWFINHNNTMFLFTTDRHGTSSSYYIHSKTIDLSNPTVKLSENSIFGLTKTAATISTAGDVYILGSGA